MTEEQLEVALKSWGRAFGEQRPDEWDEDGSPGRSEYGANGIARGMEFAPGSRQVVIRERTAHHRAGGDRRRIMGVAAGVRIVSADFVDPVPCTETRPHYGAPKDDARVTATVQAVQSAWLVLREWWPLRGEVLRLQYQVRAMSQQDKAATLGDGKDGRDLITVKRYRDELARSKLWIHARITA